MKYLFGLLALLLVGQNSFAATAIIYNFSLAVNYGNTTTFTPAGCVSFVTSPGQVLCTGTTTTTAPCSVPSGTTLSRAQVQANNQLSKYNDGTSIITTVYDSRCNTRLSGSTMSQIKVLSCVASGGPTYTLDVTCYKPTVVGPSGPSTSTTTLSQ